MHALVGCAVMLRISHMQVLPVYARGRLVMQNPAWSIA